MPFGSEVPRGSSMPMASSEEIIHRLGELADRHGEGGPTALAFDADGTLWSGDVGIDGFAMLLSERAIRPLAGPALRREAELSSLPVTADPHEQANLLFEAYERGDYPEERAFRMMAWVYAGYRADEMRDFARRVAERGNLAVRVHAEILPITEWAMGRRIPLYVVSASPAAIVRAAVEYLTLRFDGLFAMSQAVEEGMILPHVIEPATYGPGKAEAFRAGVSGARLLGAFGDSVFDLALLREALVPVAVRPKSELRRQAPACPGLVELAPSLP